MTNREERLIRDALKYGCIVILVLTIPLWWPILVLGAMICFPAYLVYMIIDEINLSLEEKRENFHNEEH